MTGLTVLNTQEDDLVYSPTREVGTKMYVWTVLENTPNKPSPRRLVDERRTHEERPHRGGGPRQDHNVRDGDLKGDRYRKRLVDDRTFSLLSLPFRLLLGLW